MIRIAWRTKVCGARSFLAQPSRIWFESRKGPGKIRDERGRGPWADWDDFFEGRSTLEYVSAQDDSVTLILLETNDFLRMIERPPNRLLIRYYFDAETKIEGMLVRGLGTEEDKADRFEEVVAWLRERYPEKLATLMPDGEIVPDLELARTWRDLLAEWREEVGLPAVD